MEITINFLRTDELMRLTCVSTNVGQRVKSGGSNVKLENAPDSHVITSTLFHSKTATTSSKKTSNKISFLRFQIFLMNLLGTIYKYVQNAVSNHAELRLKSVPAKFWKI